MNRGDLNCSKWLEVHCDRTAGIKTLPRNAVLADTLGDSNCRLVITDAKLQENNRNRLQVYKGTLCSDVILPDVPNSVISFYTNQFDPRIPAVGVACGSHLLVYKNNKPFYVFRVPGSPISPLEVTFWQKYNEDGMAHEESIEKLKTIPLNLLSSRAQAIVCALDRKFTDLIKRNNVSLPYKESPITCTSTLRKSSYDQYAVSCPIIATESGNVYILDPPTLTILHQSNVCRKEATPFIMTSVGIFDVEYRIIIGCREKLICVLRRGWLEGKVIVQLINNIIDIIVVPGDNFIMVATENQMLTCYTKRGQNLWSAKLRSLVTCLCLVPLHHLSLNLVAVGLKEGKIHLYHGRHVVDYISVTDTPSVVAFGQLEQEENVMVVVSLAGTITYRILKRTADFNVYAKENVTLPQSMQLPLPKRSKLFLEQSMREKNHFIDMHQHFQQDLFNLRLRSSRELVNNITKQVGAGNEKHQIRISTQFLGLRPKFLMVLTLQNIDPEKPENEFLVIFHANTSAYTFSSNVKRVPFMAPGISYKIYVHVEELTTEVKCEELPASNSLATIKVYASKGNQGQPIFAAMMNMPAL